MEDGTKMFCMHEVSETCLAYNALSNLEPDGRQKTNLGQPELMKCISSHNKTKWTMSNRLLSEVLAQQKYNFDGE